MEYIQSRSSELDSVGAVVSLLTEQVYTHPLAVAKLLMIKLARSWYATTSERFETANMLVQIPYLISILWSSRVAWKLGNVRKHLVISAWLMILYFWAMTITTFTIVRYMVPAMGLLFLLLPALFQSHEAESMPTLT
jgi:hypothetical protein